MTQGRATNPGERGNRPDAAAGAPPSDPGDSANGCPHPGNERRTVRVVNPRGLHPRIITLFTKTAKRYASAVTLWNGEAKADGKSVMDLIMLVVLPDTDVVLEVSGDDAGEAVGPLADILAAPGGEDYTL